MHQMDVDKQRLKAQIYALHKTAKLYTALERGQYAAPDPAEVMVFVTVRKSPLVCLPACLPAGLGCRVYAGVAQGPLCVCMCVSVCLCVCCLLYTSPSPRD